MPLSNPWLAGPLPENQLPRDQLEERILSLFSSQNMAVVATINRDGSPAATPVRYSSLGFEIFYTTWNASVKSQNLRRDPRVSAAIFAPLVGGPAAAEPKSSAPPRPSSGPTPQAKRYWEVFRWQSDHVERGRLLDEPPSDPLTVITPRRILYTEQWLRRSNYAPRQIWRAEATDR